MSKVGFVVKSLGMLNRVEKKSSYIGNINREFKWFEDTFICDVKSGMEEFWQINYEFKLISLSKKNNILFASDEYFVTQIDLTKSQIMTIRLSKTLINFIFDNVLGSSLKPFSLETMTSLEVSILNSFSAHLYKHISRHFIDKEELQRKKKSENDYNLIFGVRSNRNKMGKVIFTFPVEVLTPEDDRHDKNSINNFSVDDFPDLVKRVDIVFGKTSLTLGDIRHLHKGDIIVLEDSKLNVLCVNLGSKSLNFSIEPNDNLILSDEEDNQDNEYEDDIEDKGNDMKNLWDDIQVEVVAQFDSIKMTLGDLRQIEQGLVIDISSVYENKIHLKVDEKTVASGELVIIDDNYAVKINSIVESSKKSSKSNKVESEGLSSIQEDDTEEERSLPSGNISDQDDEKDFDYSDFDVDDEEI